MTLETTAKPNATRATDHFDEYLLGEIATVQQGYTFSPSHQGQTAGKWRYVKVGDLNAHGNTKYLDRTFNYVNDNVLEEMGAKPFPSGSIVFPRVGAALRNNNKRILRCASLTDDNVIVVTVRDSFFCSSEYLYYWFDFQDLRRFCNDGTVPVINGRNLKRQSVPLPSIELQQEIAGILSTWDTVIQKTEQLIAAKKLRRDALIQRLYALSDSRGSSSHFRELLEESMEVGSSGRHAKKISVKLYGNGVLPKEEKRQGSEQTQYFVRRAGQLIYSKLDFLNGAFGIVPPELDGHESTLDLPAFDVAPTVNPVWLLGYLTRPTYCTRQLGLARGQRKARRVHPSDLLRSSLRVPSRDLQDRIADILTSSQCDIDKSNRLLQAMKTQKRGLMGKLLTGQWRLPVPKREAA